MLLDGFPAAMNSYFSKSVTVILKRISSELQGACRTVNLKHLLGNLVRLLTHQTSASSEQYISNKADLEGKLYVTKLDQTYRQYDDHQNRRFQDDM